MKTSSFVYSLLWFSTFAVFSSTSVQAELDVDTQRIRTQNSSIPQIRDRKAFLRENRSATTLKEWEKNLETHHSNLVSQNSPVPVTGVKLNQVDTGLEIILETQDGKPLQIDATKFRTENNRLIADIPNAVLTLTDVQEFSADSPTTDIANVRVIQTDASNIQVVVTGKDALPKSEVTLTTGALSYSLNSEGDTAEEEVVVTGEGRTPYRASSSGTATGTNIPILETPFSIQIVPKDVLRDQQTTRLEEALLNVSSVAIQGNASSRTASFSLRGFENAPTLRDGFRRYGSFQASPEIANLEQIEVLKGAASILYGEIQPGGVVNLVSKKPLSNPFYEAELELGSRGLFSPRVDFSGPVTPDAKLLYRVNALISTQAPFQNFNTNFERAFIAPTLAWKISDRTDLGFSLEYLNKRSPADFGLPVIGRSVVDVPRDFVSTDPNDAIESQFLSVGYDFEHRFSQNWKIRNAFRYSSYDYDFNTVLLPFGFDEETATIGRVFASQDGQNENFSLLTNLLGEFTTGSVKHVLLFGVDLNRSQDRIFSVGDFLTFLPLNIFNPVYGQPPTPSEADLPPFGGNYITTNRLGIYVQDQISLFDRLTLLAGIRYDTVDQTNKRVPGLFTEPGKTTQTDDAFTPRLGLLYQVSKTVSLYGSYSQSFNPGSATTAAGDVIEPERGEGYEVGIKTELLNRKLLATAAYFDITKQNVAVTDPDFPLFSVASGEQRSRGVEFDIVGELTPGWNLIASYTYTDTQVTEDSNPDLIGNQLFGVPKHSASLWTTYEIQRGNLQGLGVGFGFNFVGERQGDLANSYEVDSYFITNAAIFYRRGNWRFAVNFKNLGDVKYIESTSNGRESGNFFGEPFTVIGSVSVQF
ncbi:TonB-dependent siderophore receptor [Kovacikia minuta CCNUW1]|uniref:TonB-dependent siderophore receptor n=1 Tax=Kovacikia minuta TaxID=2931930 RepID=UPI001CCC34C1|nr:TonB-dependent siderophore receptor [Kovacikia minuta]UBF26362.1 TonB-dependent siderophore receptor [Kovacikia minuta CCNUW1]